MKTFQGGLSKRILEGYLELWGKQISFGSWPVSLETLSIEGRKLLHSSNSCPVHILKLVIYLSIVLCFCHLFDILP